MTVADITNRAAVFGRHRARLFGIAYRMLGTVEDAEDLVQETYLRWEQADVPAVRAPEGWLVAVITRLGIDRLRRVAVERRSYPGPWLPEPVATADWAVADHAAELASDLSLAFLVLLERLAPEERAAFLLREVFDTAYDEIARVLEKSETACRQMVHRARERVRRGHARFTVPAEAKERLVGRFLAALKAGDRDALLALFAADATWTSDGGGKVAAARRMLRGADRIVRFLLGLERKWPGVITHRVEEINGAPAIVGYAGERVYKVTSFDCDANRIFAAYSVLNPDKLRRLPATSVEVS